MSPLEAVHRQLAQEAMAYAIHEMVCDCGDDIRRDAEARHLMQRYEWWRMRLRYAVGRERFGL